MQRVLPAAINASAAVDDYARKRHLLCQGLEACGYTFTPPAGTFYLFARSPAADDMAFVKTLQDLRILAVPGRAFGCPGYFQTGFLR